MKYLSVVVLAITFYATVVASKRNRLDSWERSGRNEKEWRNWGYQDRRQHPNGNRYGFERPWRQGHDLNYERHRQHGLRIGKNGYENYQRLNAHNLYSHSPMEEATPEDTFTPMMEPPTGASTANVQTATTSDWITPTPTPAPNTTAAHTTVHGHQPTSEGPTASPDLALLSDEVANVINRRDFAILEKAFSYNEGENEYDYPIDAADTTQEPTREVHEYSSMSPVPATDLEMTTSQRPETTHYPLPEDHVVLRHENHQNLGTAAINGPTPPVHEFDHHDQTTDQGHTTVATTPPYDHTTVTIPSTDSSTDETEALLAVEDEVLEHFQVKFLQGVSNVSEEGAPSAAAFFSAGSDNVTAEEDEIEPASLTGQKAQFLSGDFQEDGVDVPSEPITTSQLPPLASETTKDGQTVHETIQDTTPPSGSAAPTGPPQGTPEPNTQAVDPESSTTEATIQGPHPNCNGLIVSDVTGTRQLRKSWNSVLLLKLDYNKLSYINPSHLLLRYIVNGDENYPRFAVLPPQTIYYPMVPLDRLYMGNYTVQICAVTSTFQPGVLDNEHFSWKKQAPVYNAEVPERYYPYG